MAMPTAGTLPWSWQHVSSNKKNSSPTTSTLSWLLCCWLYYNTRLPPSTSSLSSPEPSEGSGLQGLGARQAAQNLSSCHGQQQQQQQQAMQQGQCPQAAAPNLVEGQFLSCALGLAEWPSMTAVPPSVTEQCSQGSQNGPHGCCGTMGNATGFFPQGCFQRQGFLSMHAVSGQGCYLLETNHRTVWDLSRINHQQGMCFLV